MQELEPNTEAYECERVFKLLDVNQDEKLEYKEFISIFKDSNDMNDEIMIE